MSDEEKDDLTKPFLPPGKKTRGRKTEEDFLKGEAPAAHIEGRRIGAPVQAPTVAPEATGNVRVIERMSDARLSVDVPHETLFKLKMLAASQRMSVRDLVRNWLRSIEVL